MIERLV
ncbi:hypothetical protein YPPY29_4377, partial [Yersinia pestis PY-29]